MRGKYLKALGIFEKDSVWFKLFESTFIPTVDDVNYWWCLHCSRTFKGPVSMWDAGVPDKNAFMLLPDGNPMLKCPYKDCDGSPIDLFDWDSNYLQWSSELATPYPKEPAVGVVYPMYPDKDYIPALALRCDP